MFEGIRMRCCNGKQPAYYKTLLVVYDVHCVCIKTVIFTDHHAISKQVLQVTCTTKFGSWVDKILTELEIQVLQPEECPL